jgi:hypothetical protein
MVELARRAREMKNMVRGVRLVDVVQCSLEKSLLWITVKVD